MKRPNSGNSGIIYVEFILVIIPMLVLFWGMMQLNGLLLADLVVRHAAVNAVRAAIVCDSDEHTHGQAGAEACAQQAAEATTKSVKSIKAVVVTVAGASESGNEPVTATVTADYSCQVPLVGGLACAFFRGEATTSAIAIIQRQATLPNQGHYYKF
jgi:Flp pilus assembly protein TadG